MTCSRLWSGFYLCWLTKQNTTHKIPGTSTVYWVAWFVYDFRKTKAEICSIWNRVKWQNTRQDRIPDNFGLHKNAIKPIKPIFLLQKRVFCILNKEIALCILSFILNDVSPPTSTSGKFDLGRWVGFSYFLHLDWVSINDIAKSRKIRVWGSK